MGTAEKRCPTFGPSPQYMRLVTRPNVISDWNKSEPLLVAYLDRAVLAPPIHGILLFGATGGVPRDKTTSLRERIFCRVCTHLPWLSNSLKPRCVSSADDANILYSLIGVAYTEQGADNIPLIPARCATGNQRPKP